ncbi:MAG: hypothetical protein MPW16_06345 [Candidatus Manganitrophus sp.]|nr:MAG: hypothetical protein MPW16_06345 [Candidatus Manganitrophus sp.]
MGLPFLCKKKARSTPISSITDRICFSSEQRGAIEQMHIEMVANRGICLQRSGAAYRPKGIAFRSRM